MRKFVIIITAAVLAVFFVAFYIGVPVGLLRPPFHAEIIARYAERYGFDPLFLTSVIREESGFDMRARSERGAVGLMQLMPATARELADELELKDYTEADLERPEINIRLGTYFLYKLRREFSGDQVLTLAAYNAGLGKVQYWRRLNPLLSTDITSIPYRETRNYVKDILNTYRWLKTFQRIRNRISGGKP